MVQEVDLRLRYKQERGDILVSNTEEAINESLRNIFDTNIGTRLFNRSFGSRIQNILFEPMSEVSAKFILMEMQQVVDRLEPRVKLIQSQSQIIPEFDNNAYNVRLTYRILDTDDTGNFNLFLERIVR